MRGTTNARKFIILATNIQNELQLDLQDKIRPDLIDNPLSGPESKPK